MTYSGRKDEFQNTFLANHAGVASLVAFYAPLSQ
jgi:hypothetical protein